MPKELLARGLVVGRVSWYFRASDQSAALGVRVCKAFDLDGFYQVVCELLEAGKGDGTKLMRTTVATLDTVLERCDNQGAKCFAYCHSLSVAECVRRLRRVRLQLQRSIDATESRLATAPKTGPCTKFREADPFFALKRGGRGRKQGVAA